MTAELAFQALCDRAGREQQDLRDSIAQELRAHESALFEQLLSTFRDERKALEWFATPSVALGCHSPLELLASGDRQELIDELVRIEFGDFV